jgi:hypothetical protein
MIILYDSLHCTPLIVLAVKMPTTRLQSLYIHKAEDFVKRTGGASDDTLVFIKFILGRSSP